MHNRAATRQLTPVEHYDERVDRGSPCRAFNKRLHLAQRGRKRSLDFIGHGHSYRHDFPKRLSYSYIRDIQSLANIPQPNLKSEHRS